MPRVNDLTEITPEYNEILSQMLEQPFDAPAVFGPMPHARAQRLRQWIYSWRRCAYNICCNPSKPGAAASQEWMKMAIHPNCDVEHLYCSIFQVEQRADGFYLLATLQTPVAGPIPRDNRGALPIHETVAAKLLRHNIPLVLANPSEEDDAEAVRRINALYLVTPPTETPPQ